MSTESILTVNSISCTYGDFQAISNVSLELKQGEIVSILGSNGAGKTTLINAMLGKKELSKGDLSVFGYAPGSMNAKRNIGAMLQIAALPDHVKVKEHLTLFRSYYGNPMSESELVSLAGLEEILESYSNELSGGQKQRVLFALALCGNPRLLFLDEPSVGMDVKSRHRLWQAMRQLKERGVCIVLTTHYLEEADQLSDRILLLDRGKIQQQGTPSSIKQSISNQTIKCSTDVPAEAFTQLDEVTSAVCTNRYCVIQTTDATTTLQAIFNANYDIQQLTVSDTSLEDVLMAMDDETDEAA